MLLRRGRGAALGYGAARTDLVGRASAAALRGPVIPAGARRRLALYANAHADAHDHQD